MGWKKVQFELLNGFNGFYCDEQDVFTKVWLYNENLICLACLTKNINFIHSFGNYQEQKENFTFHWYYGEKIQKWAERIKRKYDLNYIDTWFKKQGVTTTRLSEFFFKERLKQLAVLSEKK